MSFKDLHIEAPPKKNPSSLVPPLKGKDSELELINEINLLQQTSKFGQVKEELSKITFRNEEGPSIEYQDENYDYVNLNNPQERAKNSHFTPQKNKIEVESQQTITKKPSLVFKSGQRNVIYFEDNEENMDLGDVKSRTQVEHVPKLVKNENKVHEISSGIIERLRVQGSVVNEEAIFKSVEMILSMPPE